MNVETQELGWIKTPLFLIIAYKGKTVTLAKGSPEYQTAMKFVRNGSKRKLAEFLFLGEKFKKYTRGEFVVDEQKNKIIHTKTQTELHPAFIEKLKEFAQKSLSYRAFKKFFENLMRNPDKNSIEQFYNFLSSNHFTITEDGCLLAYKYVTKNDQGQLVDSHTKTFNNKVGNIVVMDRSKCDPDRNVACSTGLHVAAYSYASSCGGGETVIEVKVNPKDIVSVPNDYNNQKIRVCRYEVLKEGAKEITKSYVNTKLKLGVSNIEPKTVECKDTVLLEGKTAEQVKQIVFNQTGEQITLSSKNKRAIVKKAISVLQKHGLNVDVATCDLRNMSATQIADFVAKKIGVFCTISSKNKQGTLKWAKQTLEGENFVVLI